jgi:hypothetical protein
MRNSLALLGIPDLPIYAFCHVGDRKIQPQGGVSSVIESASSAISDVGSGLASEFSKNTGFIGGSGGLLGQIEGGITDTVGNVSDALAEVDDTVNKEIPGGWATVINVATAGQAAPYVQAVQAGNVIAKGGSLEDAAKGYVISSLASEAGGAVGAETGSNFAGNVAGGTAGGLLSGKSLEESLKGGVTGGVISQATPSTISSSSGTSGQGTTGANNMAVDDYTYYGGGDTYDTTSQQFPLTTIPSQDITGGEGFYDTGSTPYTQEEIDALTAQTYGGASGFSSLDAATQALLKKALATGGTAAQGAKNYLSSLFGGTSGANLLQGGLQTAGGLMQTQASKDAALKAQQDLLAATGSATAGSQFRPVGVTTRFGTSQFNINPATGQLESAGYTAAPEITSAQNKLLGLGASYLAQTPEEVAQQYLSKQYELLDPSRQRQLASIRNQAFQTGRGGLSVGSTGLRPSGAQGLMGTNPELEAYYNALAQQDAQLAAGAQTAGQQQVLYGAGLFGQAGNLESMAQQPFTLGTGLGTSISGAGANAGRLGLTGASLAAGYGTSPAATTSPGAYIASGLGSPTSTLGQGLANWLTSTPTTGGVANQGINTPTVDAYGNYVPLGYANY